MSRWRPTLKPVDGFSTDEAAYAAVGRLGRGVRLGEHRERGTVLGVRDEHLGAVQDVLLAVLHGGRAYALHVAAGVRLGEAEAAAHLARCQARKEPLLLLLRAARGHNVRENVVGADDSADAHPALAQFLEYHGEGGVVQPHPAVLLGDGDAEQPHFAHRRHKLVRVDVLVVVPVRDRLDLAPDEVPDHVDYLPADFRRSVCAQVSILSA